MSDALSKGDLVCFKERKVSLYRQIYGVTEDDVLTVRFVEHRGAKKVLYLEAKGRTDWIPAYPSALLTAKSRKRRRT